MKKFMLALLLSAALISTHHQEVFNNSGLKAPPAKAQASVTSVKQAATPVPAVPAVQTVAQGCDAYRGTFAKYSWNVNTAIAICKAESNGNIYAISPTCDRGLMQINCIHADMVNGDLTALYNPSTNISVAARIYGTRGWSAWSTYLNSKYLSYLE